MSKKSVHWGEEVYDPSNIYYKSTTTPNPGISQSGFAYPGNKYYGAPEGSRGYKRRVPSGSVTQDGKMTGDFRGIGVVNPWGGSKRKRRNTKKRMRRVTKKRRSNRNSRTKK